MAATEREAGRTGGGRGRRVGSCAHRPQQGGDLVPDWREGRGAQEHAKGSVPLKGGKKEFTVRDVADAFLQNSLWDKS